MSVFFVAIIIFDGVKVSWKAVHPVVGAVSASHCIVVVGDEQKVNVGDIATLVGPDHPDIEPNAVNKAAGVSVYDLLMHMNPTMPKFISG